VVTWRPEPTAGWPAFVAWSFCGALWAVSVLSFVGLFTLPLAAGLTWLLIRYTTDRHDALGLVAGVAALFVYIGSAHIGEPPCPESGVLAIPQGESSASCTNFVSTPWLVAGILLLVVGLVLYRMARNRHPKKPQLATPS
jgi:amino acid transporter